MCFEGLQAAWRMYQQTPAPELMADIEAVYRTYEELKPFYESE